MQYTPAQQGAIDNKDMHKLICAIPGSGKTHLTIGLVERILKSCPDAKVLSVTFTNAASKEMKGRLSKILSQQVIEERCHISTFASLMIQQAKPLTKRKSLKIGYATRPFANRAIRECGYIEKEDREMALAALDNSAKVLDSNELTNEVRELRDTYDYALRSSNSICLDTLVRELIVALKNGDVALHGATHIVVDEFQDTDTLQYEWLRLHGEAGAIITAVGDDDQSIYSWRDSKGYENMAELIMDFKIKPTVLERCFRCPQEVLDAASRLIEHNKDRVPKKLTSGIGTQGTVRRVPITTPDIKEVAMGLYEQPSVTDEAKAYYEEIINKIGKKSVANLTPVYVASQVIEAPGEWAILARTNIELDDIEEALSALDQPYIRMGGKSIWDNELTIAIAQALYVVCVRRNARYLGALLLHGEEETEVISSIVKQAISQGFLGVSEITVEGQWNANTKALYALAQHASNGGSSPAEVFSEVCKWVWSIEAKAIDERSSNKNAAAAVKERVFESFCRYRDRVGLIFLAGSASLSYRAQSVTDKVFSKPYEKSLNQRTNEIVLSTINSSKGLEFKRVWITSVETNMIPSKIDYTMMADGPVVLPTDTENHKLCEERRLLYVAMTRAESELVFSYRPDYGSGFLREIFGDDVLADLD